MSLRHLILYATLGLSGAFTAQAATVADLVEQPSWMLSSQLAAEGNVHTTDLIAAFQTSTDDDVKAVLLQTLIMIADPSAERTAFLTSGAFDAAVSPYFQLWMKIGLACDAPNDRMLIEQFLADENIANDSAWQLINILSLEARSPELHAFVANAVIDHIIALIKTHSQLVTRSSQYIVSDFMAGLGERAGPDSLMQQRIEALAGDASISAITYDLAGHSVASLLASFAGAHTGILPPSTSDLLLNYFLADDVLNGVADESDDSWMSRRYRLLNFTSDLLGTLKRNGRPSYPSMIEASLSALLSSDIAEARAGTLRHIKFLPDPLRTLENLVLSGNVNAISTTADALRDLDLSSADTARDAFKKIIERLELVTFDTSISLESRLSPALTLIYFEHARTDAARSVIREGLSSNDERHYNSAIWCFSQLPTYHADDARVVADILIRNEDERFLVDLLDTISNALANTTKRTAWLEEQAISNALLILVRRPGRVGDAAEYALRTYIELLR